MIFQPLKILIYWTGVVENVSISRDFKNPRV